MDKLYRGSVYDPGIDPCGPGTASASALGNPRRRLGNVCVRRYDSVRGHYRISIGFLQ